jgi:hypothetical protein
MESGNIDKAVYVLACIAGYPKDNHNVTFALKELIKCCQDKSFGLKMPDFFPIIQKNAIYPVAAAGVVHWIKIILLDLNYFETSYHTQVTPILLTILCDMASKFAVHRQSIFDVLYSAFHLQSNLEALELLNFQALLIKCFIHLVHLGMIPEVFGMLSVNADRMDLSLIRLFFTSLLDSISVPYSAGFTSELCVLLSNGYIVQAIRGNEVSRRLVESVLSSCNAAELLGGVYSSSS